MKKIAIYGKGGIGKSTTVANVSVALAKQNYKICQIGCDPKNDSTRLLLGRICPSTVLDCVKKYGDDILLEQILHYGYLDIKCAEAGGPEPGVGCAGRGIIVALEKLKELNAANECDYILYDVLGDVVCGGFAVPIREGYASEIYIVSSGELMSLYAANNIAKGIQRFANRGKVRLGGIIGNSRNIKNEKALLEDFSKQINTNLITFIPRDEVVNQAEINRKTVIEYAPDTPAAEVYRQLAQKITSNSDLTIPKPLRFDELEKLVLEYGNK